MSKKWILAICLIASAQAKSNELSSLVDASTALRQTFANGIIAVGGMMESAPNGGIPGNDILANKDAYITAQKQLAYNSAVQAMQAGSFTNMGAQDFFEQQDQLTDLFGEFKGYELGIGHCKDHGNSLIGFKDGETVCLHGEFEKKFPQLVYQYQR